MTDNNIYLNNDDLQHRRSEVEKVSAQITEDSGKYIDELRKHCKEQGSEDDYEKRVDEVLKIAPHLYDDEEDSDFFDPPYYRLAHAYFEGKYGVEQDVAKGLEWLKKSADRYCYDAMYEYSRILASGTICDVDYAKAWAYASEGIGWDSYTWGVHAECDEVLTHIWRAIYNAKYDFFYNYSKHLVIRRQSDSGQY